MIDRSLGSTGRRASLVLLAVAFACKTQGGPELSSGTPTLNAPSNAPSTVKFSSSGACAYSLDFGQVAVGSSSSLDIPLENSGGAPLQVLSVQPPTDQEFTMTLSQQAIQPGSTATATMAFKPFGEGAKSATVNFTTDSQECPSVTVSLAGTGVILKLQAMPQTVDFGSVVVHSSPVQAVTLTNQSNLDIGVTPAAIAGPQASLFSVDKAAGTTFTVPANQSVQMNVTYSPLAPSMSDTANLALALSEGGNIVIDMHGIALQSGLKITPIPLNFAFVQPGNSVTQALHLSNVGNENITVTSASIVDPGSPAAFSIASGSWSGGQLAPGESKDVNVTFSPSVKTQYTGELDVSSTDSTNIVPVALTGFGGGAIISCAPLNLDFGTVAANIGTTLPVICTNTGSDVPNHPEAGVILSTLTSDNTVFAGQVDPGSINPASKTQPLAAGQSVEIDVIYTPVATANDKGTLKINSNATDGTSLAPPTVSMTGSAILLPPCTYTVTPGSVNFGQVKPGTQIPGGFVITNTGANECLVTGLNLSAGTQNVFTLASGPVTSQKLSGLAQTPPGTNPTQLNVNVDFAPQQTGSYSGAVQFTISDPSSPHQSVNLTGVGGNSCFLISPALLDYGTVGISNGQFCANGKRKFVGVNGCAQSVTIQSVTMETGGGVFSLLSGSGNQVVPQGGTSTPFVVGFKPNAAGTYTGGALVQTDLQSTPYGAGFTGAAINGSVQTDKFAGHTPQVDVLWVMDTDDDPGERWIIAQKASDFVDALNKVNLDYQIGVTTTDWCQGGMTGTSENGKLLPCPGCKIDGQQPTIITPADENAGPDLQEIMQVNSGNCTGNVQYPLGMTCDGKCTWSCNGCYPDEQFFNAGYEAVVSTTNQAYNSQLIRPNAYLALITMNGDNEDDNSRTQTPQWFANQFLSVKGADHPELFSWSYINPSQFGSSGGHQPFNRLPERLASLLSLAGGVALDTQQSDWEQGVLDLWNIVLASSTRFPLSGTPDPTTIQVYLDGPPPGQVGPGQTQGVQILGTNPNGSSNWTYESTSNTLDVNNANLTLSSSDTLYVEYTLVCN
jgi:hypothetical protein